MMTKGFMTEALALLKESKGTRRRLAASIVQDHLTDAERSALKVVVDVGPCFDTGTATTATLIGHGLLVPVIVRGAHGHVAATPIGCEVSRAGYEEMAVSGSKPDTAVVKGVGFDMAAGRDETAVKRSGAGMMPGQGFVPTSPSIDDAMGLKPSHFKPILDFHSAPHKGERVTMIEGGRVMKGSLFPDGKFVADA